MDQYIQTAVKIVLPVHQGFPELFQRAECGFIRVMKVIEHRKKVVVQKPDVFLTERFASFLLFLTLLIPCGKPLFCAVAVIIQRLNHPAVFDVLSLIIFHDRFTGF